MTVLWPYALLLLLLIPLLIAAYLWLLRRKRKFAVRYASLSLIREALPRRSRWRQHLPFALFLLSIASLVFAMARPQVVVEVPLSRTSIILALDVSRSMCATDVDPNRLTVAQEAARAFIEDQADGTQIGIVAFAGFAELVVPPTTDKTVLTKAIDSFTTSLGTAIGNATLKSIDAIAEVNPDVVPSGVDLSRAVDRETLLDSDEYVPDIIVLLTDGANSRGVNPIQAAEQAVDRRVRVYTIGFGTTDPVAIVCTREQLGGDVFGGQFGGGNPGSFGGNFGGGASGGFGGIRQFLVIDEPMLQAIAEMTGGSYYRAENADQLLDVFLNLPTQIVLQEENLEISVVFTALGALLATLAVGLSLMWNRIA
ncbi:MAG: VWA domain-containing protein [Chloroflexota bacterium]|nr:VWA domain-containing protein [Chloroflexota bacterium]